MNKRRLKTLGLLIIIAVIIGVGIYAANQGLKMMKQKHNDDVRTDLLLIQAKIKVIEGKAEVNSDTECYIGSKISELEENGTKEFLKSIQIKENEFEKYYILSIQDLENMGIADLLKHPDDNEYIVNYETADVIYKKGIEEDGQVKYKISEIIPKENPKYWILHDRAQIEE